MNLSEFERIILDGAEQVRTGRAEYADGTVDTFPVGPEDGKASDLVVRKLLPALLEGFRNHGIDDIASESASTLIVSLARISGTVAFEIKAADAVGSVQ